MTPDVDAIPEQPSYIVHWLFLVALGFAAWHFYPRIVGSPFTRVQRSASIAEVADYFLILKFPEVATIDSAAVKTARQQTAGWIQAMLDHGYHPMLLSDVMEQRKVGKKLPEKAVVILFDPGYRSTYDALSPVFESKRLPVVWLTRSEGLEDYDLRYLSKHLYLQLHTDRGWDTGMSRADQRTFFLNVQDGEEFGRPYVWADGINWRGKNFLTEKSGLERLAVRSYWTNDDLLKHLNAEVPTASTCYLVAESVNNRLKGLNVPLVHGNDVAAFDLSTARDKRLRTVFWKSTERVEDFNLDVSLQELEGEFWMLIRSDEDLSNGVRIGFSKDLVSVEEIIGGRSKQIALGPVVWDSKKPFAASVSVQNSRLDIFVRGKSLIRIPIPAAGHAHRSKFGVMLFHRVRGAAQVKNVSLKFTPTKVAE